MYAKPWALSPMHTHPENINLIYLPSTGQGEKGEGRDKEREGEGKKGRRDRSQYALKQSCSPMGSS